MDKKLRFAMFILVGIVLIGGIYFLNNYTSLSNVSVQTMKYCINDNDCTPVDCGCSCSGCGGFSYDDVVNKKYADAWYSQQCCKPAKICPLVCCPLRKVSCENNVCVVKEGAS